MPSPVTPETASASADPSAPCDRWDSSTRSAFVPTTIAGAGGELAVVRGELSAQEREVRRRVGRAQVHDQDERPAPDDVA